MIRHFQLRINIADKDPAVLEPKLRHSLDTITSRHPALRGYTIDPAPAGTLEATLRVSGVHQWAASANARNIATAAVARLVLPASQAQLIPLEAPRTLRTVTKAQGRPTKSGRPRKNQTAEAPNSTDR